MANQNRTSVGTTGLTLGFNPEKGTFSVYNMGQYPTTFYYNQAIRLNDAMPDIMAEIETRLELCKSLQAKAKQAKEDAKAALTQAKELADVKAGALKELSALDAAVARGTFTQATAKPRRDALLSILVA